MVNKTMGIAIVAPIPLKAPMELQTEGGGGFSFILHPVCLFLYYTYRIIAYRANELQQ
jgi:hypothetical protein